MITKKAIISKFEKHYLDISDYALQKAENDLFLRTGLQPGDFKIYNVQIESQHQ